MNYILQSDDIYFRYEDGTAALQGVTLKIEEGKKTVLLGGNGAGKSTLFLHFNGIYRPHRGTIFFDGEEIQYKNSFLKHLRKNIGVVFQDPDTQLFSANVYQDISFGPINLGLSEKEVKARVIDAMEKTGVKHLSNKPTHLLSYGEKKRAAIAGVLAVEPKVIVFDEPTAWLDPAGYRQIVRLIEEINRQGKTVVLSTHDVDLAYSWADLVIVMKEGKVIGQGTPQEIFQNKQLLSEASLVQPWLLEVYDKLVVQGWLNKATAPPANKKELYRLLGDNHSPDL